MPLAASGAAVLPMPFPRRVGFLGEGAGLEATSGFLWIDTSTPEDKVDDFQRTCSDLNLLTTSDNSPSRFFTSPKFLITGTSPGESESPPCYNIGADSDRLASRSVPGFRRPGLDCVRGLRRGRLYRRQRHRARSPLDRERVHQMALMLQTLLAERFHLKVHRETKQGRFYALTIALGGPKLQEVKGGKPGGAVDRQSCLRRLYPDHRGGSCNRLPVPVR